MTGFEQDGPTISSGVLRPIGMGHDYLRVKESTNLFSIRVSATYKNGRPESNWITYKIQGSDLTEALTRGSLR